MTNENEPPPVKYYGKKAYSIKPSIAWPKPIPNKLAECRYEDIDEKKADSTQR